LIICHRFATELRRHRTAADGKRRWQKKMAIGTLAEAARRAA
jgi:hypothetical protein